MARRKKSGSDGWRWSTFLLGLALGLTLALWVYPRLTEWWSQPSSAVVAENPSSSPTFDFYDILERGEQVVEETRALTSPPASGPAGTAGPEPSSQQTDRTASTAAAERPASTVADTESAPAAPARVDAPGMYVLQMGAFTRQAEAESVKARLGLVGMSARVQPVMVDRQTYYRVRIGPTDDLEKLNADRARLQRHRFDSILLKLVE